MKSILTSILIACAIYISKAQTKSYTDIKGIYGSGINTIIERGNVKGYSIFRLIGKATKNESNYRLTFLDSNLTELHSLDLQKPNYLRMCDGVFNGECYCFSIVGGPQTEYMFFDKNYKNVGSYKIDGFPQGVHHNDEKGIINEGGFVAVEDKGFLLYRLGGRSGRRILLQMFDNNGNIKWTANSGVPAEERSFEIVTPLYTNKNHILYSLSAQDKIQKVETGVVCVETESGKTVFKIPANYNPKYNLIPYGADFDEVTNEFCIYGNFAKTGDNVSLGLYIQLLDKSGKITKEKFFSWAENMLKIAPELKKNKTSKDTSVNILKIIRVSGEIFAIGEQFKITGNGVDINTDSFNAVEKLYKAEIYNTIIYKLDADLNIITVHMIEKNKTTIQLPTHLGSYDPLPRSLFINGPPLSYYVRMAGGFDYLNTYMTENGKKFNVAYSNYDKESKKASKFIAGIITYTDKEKFINNKANISTTASSFYIKPAKPGYICIFEYFSKLEKLDIRLEKLNP